MGTSKAHKRARAARAKERVRQAREVEAALVRGPGRVIKGSEVALSMEGKMVVTEGWGWTSEDQDLMPSPWDHEEE